VTEALPHGALVAFENYERNMKWAKAHDSELDRYIGDYIAVDGERVVATGASPEDIRPKVSGRVGVYITYVSERGLIWIL